jgi:hypothetical protein
VRWWFTTRAPALTELVRQAVEAEDLRRSLLLPPDVFGPHPTTDGGPFHLEGVPLVNFLTAPMYLFDSQDTLDKVHEASLVPITRAAIRIVEGLRGLGAASLRSAESPPRKAPASDLEAVAAALSSRVASLRPSTSRGARA